MGTAITRPNPCVWLVFPLLAIGLTACRPPADPRALAATLTVAARGATTLLPAVEPTVPAPAATEVPTPPPETVVPPTVAEPSATLASLAIIAFSCDVEDAAEGKRLTFAWQTAGAARARLVSGASMRFPQQWEVPANGTHTADVAWTYYANPAMTLIASDDAGNEVKASITIDWPCRYSYFFANPAAACPLAEATTSWAAEEPFERGRMLWLQEVRSGEVVETGVIFVLYDDNRWQRFADTWAEGQPESDASLVPPAGLLQPIRGFGKVWRENAAVRDKIGWARGGEQGFTTTLQWQARESPPNVAYLQTSDGQVMELSGMQDGTWKRVAP